METIGTIHGILHNEVLNIREIFFTSVAIVVCLYFFKGIWMSNISSIIMHIKFNVVFQYWLFTFTLFISFIHISSLSHWHANCSTCSILVTMVTVVPIMPNIQLMNPYFVHVWFVCLRLIVFVLIFVLFTVVINAFHCKEWNPCIVTIYLVSLIMYRFENVMN